MSDKDSKPYSRPRWNDAQLPVLGKELQPLTKEEKAEAKKEAERMIKKFNSKNDPEN